MEYYDDHHNWMRVHILDRGAGGGRIRIVFHNCSEKSRENSFIVLQVVVFIKIMRWLQTINEFFVVFYMIESYQKVSCNLVLDLLMGSGSSINRYTEAFNREKKTLYAQ